MSLNIDTPWLVMTLLVSVRVAAAMAIAPIFGPAKTPAAVKVLLAIGLSAFLAPNLTAPAPIETYSVGQLALAAVGEAVIGMAFGFGFMAAYAATQVAGRSLDVQIGFGAASILNPATQNPAPLIGSVFGMAMVAVFLAMDGHHLLLRALAASLTTLPPNGSNPNLILILEHSAVMFTFGLALAAPVMFMLWLADIAMAVFARSMPQLNVFVLSFAVKILLGTIGLAISVGMTRALFGGLFDTVFHFWDRLSTAN